MENINKTKKIVVISGVTGAIGSALFAKYAQENGTVVYGISRKGLVLNKFLRNGKLPLKTLICSIDSAMDYSELFESIDYGVDEIVYVHAMGLYPFEVNVYGEIQIENDLDKDGINDEVIKLTRDAFISATQSLAKFWQGKTTCIIFAGIADKYKPAVHQSWWKTIRMVKDYMRREVGLCPKLSMFVVNISSLICPHEVITRPFVFTDTDADPRYWLNANDLTNFVSEKIKGAKPGFFEYDKFKIKPGFDPEHYYDDMHFTPRKIKELF